MDRFLQENTFIPLMVAGILIMLAFALAFVLFATYSQKKLLRKQVLHQEQLLHSNILTQEEERKRIARDLHDEIGSKLNVILLNIYRLKEVAMKYSDVSEITDEVESVIHKTIDSTRRISHELLPPTLEEFGLIEAIHEFQYSINQVGSVHMNFQVDEEPLNIEEKLIELNLFRVLQELTNNSIRHGGASKIEVAVHTEKDRLVFDYSDNGCGFDISHAEQKKGLGMKNIESRLKMIDAEYSYKTEEGAGLKLTVSVKLAPTEIHQ